MGSDRLDAETLRTLWATSQLYGGRTAHLFACIDVLPLWTRRRWGSAAGVDVLPLQIYSHYRRTANVLPLRTRCGRTAILRNFASVVVFRGYV